MQDGIIKGLGNSRWLKSSIGNTTTWQQFLSSLIAGTLPIDLNGINETGWDQLGTALNKANLLSDETAEKYPGLPENPVPNDVFSLLADQTSRLKLINSFETTGTEYVYVVLDSVGIPRKRYLIELFSKTLPSSGNRLQVSITMAAYYDGIEQTNIYQEVSCIEPGQSSIKTGFDNREFCTGSRILLNVEYTPDSMTANERLNYYGAVNISGRTCLILVSATNQNTYKLNSLRISSRYGEPITINVYEKVNA